MSRALDLSSVAWRKSSHSGSGDNSGGNNCLEVAVGNNGLVVPVRDSKRPHGPTLLIPAPAWAAFLTDLRS
ncbi:DUF397 domain-containing protein [Streptomyces mobaraensis NBRC 13819 = DSM 40847]|uniref:Regulatory protein n=1 Tax=Streptomyces mobaraensis (strain ATCC 29032 / DSM 40847 / JCM 4168 / NBRC 13819 / NCIMB 11159 / IPCR 16-22) TaxID=1223523 RepID=M3BEK9_STRM1|nr:DUF397 domain-containing protein [Streptomyces mobaraensis]EME97994.1 regulatory protein [Streptomyces mobaraensis NBRC 13819 = DSM 40847]QTT74364.1 DUF397 domain-containing protein [Streptomyces mobaraensis NBRC 13819 = DSM 40847]